MRDLHAKKQRVSHNRVKKAPKQRKPINWGPILKWLSRGIGGAALCSALGFGGWKLYGYVSHATLFRLETIEESPLTRVSREEMISLAGIRPGDSMLGVRLKGVVAQLSKNPWLEQIQVKRYFPHTISISATERSPRAVANVGCLYYLDEKGVLFKSLIEGDRLDYPLITGGNEEDLQKDPAGSKEALKTALQLIETLKKASVFSLNDVSEIHYDKGYGFTLFTVQGGVPVKLGNGGFPEKLERFAGVYKDLQPQMQALDYIDLDYNDKIIVKKV